MKTVGPGAREIRMREAAGAFGVNYLANIGDNVVVLHAFQKKKGQRRERTSNLRRTAYGPGSVEGWRLKRSTRRRTRPRNRPVSADLIRCKLGKFSLDALVDLATAAGRVLQIRLASAARRRPRPTMSAVAWGSDDSALHSRVPSP